ncbi:SMI1/KNR4 family protein [uncultured Sulfitobacter sp.]|uniref:SMI1/KNR4 family protein n=1 Tax=uncultured Sulfitobacter sp. TaxID=191468 RepID=UPI002637C342|nr:SMI1/KNR4 family protein [uncultured Sulfitobacter sp.]
MTEPQDHRLTIERAEQILGVVLPPGLRADLIENGAAALGTPDGGTVEFYLSEQAEGSAIFEVDSGYLLKDMGGWGDYAENWHLTEGAFLVAENGCGDYYLLAPDKDGVARKLVFADHEVGVIFVIRPDVDAPLVELPRRQTAALEEGDIEAAECDGFLEHQHPKPPPLRPVRAMSIYPALVFALSAAGIVTVVSMFLGAFLAYRWRAAEPENQTEYTRQIKLFWRAASGWAVALVLFLAAVMLAKTGRGDVGVVVFKAAVVIAFCTQLLFTVVALFHSIRLSWKYATAGSPA